MMRHGVAIVEITTPSTVRIARVIAQVIDTTQVVTTTARVATVIAHGTVTIVKTPSIEMTSATVTVAKASATIVVVREDLSTTIGASHALTFKGESKTGLYLGFELEVELPDVQRGAEYASLALDGVAQLKHDGSIGNGFEIVTQPHTHSMYRDNSSTLWNTIETLRTEHKARSWDTDTCGLTHTHKP
jgi:hypothetical protein